MMTEKTVKIAIIAGEASGDILGAGLMMSLNARLGHNLEFIGVGGTLMEQQGLSSLFEMEEIAVMGFSAVIVRLPNILKRISQTVKAVIAAEPDILIIIDSPDFTHRVAKKVRQTLPLLPVIDYVCPSVWAWRPARAAKMTAYIDHVLAILPFEPGVLRDLGGPSATYIGHPLVEMMEEPRGRLTDGERRTVLILPGSRKGEITRLLPAFKETVTELLARRGDVNLVLPAVARHCDLIADMVSTWPLKPVIVTRDEDKRAAFMEADAALCASGTVCLELAVCGIPMISTYKLDPIARNLRFLFTTWTANLPNLIVDYLFIPEYVDEFVRPAGLARGLDRLLSNTPERAAQIAGFIKLQEKMMENKTTPANYAAEVVLRFLPD